MKSSYITISLKKKKKKSPVPFWEGRSKRWIQRCRKWKREEDLIRDWGIPLMGGSNISTIHSASVGWNSQTSTLEREEAEIESSPSCSHPDSSTLPCSVRTPDTLSPHLPTCPDCSERISMTLQHHSESSSWFTMILTAGETVSAVCMIRQRQSEQETEAERSVLVEFGEFSFRMVWSLSLMSVTEQIGAFVWFLLVWEREGEVFKPQSRAPCCPCCQDWAPVLDRDYSEPLVLLKKKTGMACQDSSCCSIERPDLSCSAAVF